MTLSEARSFLGVDKSATDEEIKKAYKTLVKKCHPDVGGTNGMFIILQSAYEICLGQASPDPEPGPGSQQSQQKQQKQQTHQEQQSQQKQQEQQNRQHEQTRQEQQYRQEEQQQSSPQNPPDYAEMAHHPYFFIPPDATEQMLTTGSPVQVQYGQWMMTIHPGPALLVGIKRQLYLDFTLNQWVSSVGRLTHRKPDFAVNKRFTCSSDPDGMNAFSFEITADCKPLPSELSITCCGKTQTVKTAPSAKKQENKVHVRLQTEGAFPAQVSVDILLRCTDAKPKEA